MRSIQPIVLDPLTASSNQEIQRKCFLGTICVMRTHYTCCTDHYTCCTYHYTCSTDEIFLQDSEAFASELLEEIVPLIYSMDHEQMIVLNLSSKLPSDTEQICSTARSITHSTTKSVKRANTLIL